MSDDPSSIKQADRNWLERLSDSLFSSEPKNKLELLQILQEASSSGLLDDEAFDIMEGALEVADKQAREVMIPRSKMVVVDIDERPQDYLPKVIESGHSRFPVIGENIDEIKGILLAKDLLPMIIGGPDSLQLDALLREPEIIPESKRLNILLREFRENRRHMALVADEYGGIAGLITIEDILEEIVGEIEDETDQDEDDMIRKFGSKDYVIDAILPIDEFNERFDTKLSNEEFETIGGLVMQSFHHVPQKGERTFVGNLEFEIIKSDNRKIYTVRLLTGDNELPKHD